jgi:hypothetical protein
MSSSEKFTFQRDFAAGVLFLSEALSNPIMAPYSPIPYTLYSIHVYSIHKGRGRGRELYQRED